MSLVVVLISLKKSLCMSVNGDNSFTSISDNMSTLGRNKNLATLVVWKRSISLCLDKQILIVRLASSRRSVSQGAAQKTARDKIKKARREEARERLWGNLTKGRSTRSWYTLWLVNFDRFCQHSSITDADEIYDMEWKIPLQSFPPVLERV